ncbi:trimethyllysine dioxygenase [Dongia mobilis]|uniref:trimethyllysine dioxygenase n=1 Tax=Dongia mobilis TaxID=578943 RepID=A0A4R6WZI8_9PROT|nr:trimethyllysine dioxygenase [Dongia mobilis]TDQ86477.1 trimethyllysine dioxygenase [Dongia mobilis]
MTHMTHAAPQQGGIEIAFGDGTSHVFTHDWLRDHCTCASCHHPETRQRLVDTFALPAGLQASAIELGAGGDRLGITWSDGHESSFMARELAATLSPVCHPTSDITTWNEAEISADFPQVSFDAMMQGDGGLEACLDRLERFGFCFVEGTPATPEGTQAVATRIAYIRETIFGGYWDFTANLQHKDTAYTSLAIGPHTDGTYAFDAPGYQMLHVLAFEGEGGENVFVDGFRIAEIMRRDTPELYRVLTEVEVPGQYIDLDRGIHLMARRPLFRLDSAGRLVQVSFNNHDRAPFALEPRRQALFSAAYATFARHANDPALQYRRRLAPGSLALFDNWRLLHARDAYSGVRRLAGAYLNKEDVESRLRVLRARRLEMAAA